MPSPFRHPPQLCRRSLVAEGIGRVVGAVATVVVLVVVVEAAFVVVLVVVVAFVFVVVVVFVVAFVFSVVVVDVVGAVFVVVVGAVDLGVAVVAAFVGLIVIVVGVGVVAPIFDAVVVVGAIVVVVDLVGVTLCQVTGSSRLVAQAHAASPQRPADLRARLLVRVCDRSLVDASSWPSHVSRFAPPKRFGLESLGEGLQAGILLGGASCRGVPRQPGGGDTLARPPKVAYLQGCVGGDGQHHETRCRRAHDDRGLHLGPLVRPLARAAMPKWRLRRCRRWVLIPRVHVSPYPPLLCPSCLGRPPAALTRRSFAL